MASRLFTALGTILLFASAAQADNNAAVLIQGGFGGTAGQNNTALIDQSHGRDNRAGSDARPIRQQGRDNRLTLIQSGNGNSAGLGDTLDPDLGVHQQSLFSDPASNTATIEQRSDTNSVGALLQSAEGTSPGGAQPGNTLTITQQSGDGNAIRGVYQRQDSASEGNIATLDQQGAGNRIAGVLQVTSGAIDGPNSATVRMIGDDNGAGLLTGAAAQSGADNGLYVQGDLDGSGPQGNNQLTLEIAGDMNQTGTIQLGTGNTIQGVGAGPALIQGDGNALGLKQTGMDNTAELLIVGDDNNVGLRQDGVANTSLFIVTGSQNTIGGLQQGMGNMATVTQTGAGNQAAFQQKGDNNVLTITQ